MADDSRSSAKAIGPPPRTDSTLLEAIGVPKRAATFVTEKPIATEMCMPGLVKCVATVEAATCNDRGTTNAGHLASTLSGPLE